MRDRRFLVVGATGHVGSKITGRLAGKGCDVAALVRRPGAVFEDPRNGVIKRNGVIRYVVGDPSDEASIRRAPQTKGDHAGSVNQGATRLIALCGEAGVRRFVQSPVPAFKGDTRVPELHGWR